MPNNKKNSDQVFEHMIELFEEIEIIRDKIAAYRKKNAEFELIQKMMSYLRSLTVKLNTLMKMNGRELHLGQL